MFKLLILVFAVLFAIAMANPAPKPQILYGGYPYAYGAYGAYPYAGGYYGGYII